MSGRACRSSVARAPGLTGGVSSVDDVQFTRTYTYDPIGNRTESTEESSPRTRTSKYNRDPNDNLIDNTLNQYVRVATSGGGGVNTGQGYRFDHDGNMIEAYIEADMNCDGVINSAHDTAFQLALTNLYGESSLAQNYTWGIFPLTSPKTTSGTCFHNTAR